jgi:hypothetical protein
MVAGMSGATAGSGGAEGPDEKEGRLMPLHAPRNTAKPAAIQRLTAARVLLELIMASPEQKSLTASVPQPSAKLLSEQMSS